MNKFIYIITYPLIVLVSLTPFWLLYFWSDILSFIVFRVIKYRVKVIRNNLKIAYPDKSIEELEKIEKKFYKHFTDIFIEMLKGFTISEKEILKRYPIHNLELIEELYEDKRSVIMMSSHYANWEWSIILGSLSPVFKGLPYAAYSPIKNQYFDKAIRKNRGRFGVELISSRETIPKIIENAKAGNIAYYGLIADQSPTLRNLNHFDYFFGVKVPVHLGTENMARKYNHAVVFLDTQKIKRGYYSSTFQLITDKPKETEPFEITRSYLRLTENQIAREPAYYFWTHKRFKHKDKTPKD